jgi:hypothetical protein
MIFGVIQVIDVANLVVAAVSLTIAIAALRISGRIAAASISRPFVIQQLYELYEYIATRRLDTDLDKDIDRLFNEIERVRTKRLILEQAGFGRRLEEMEQRIHEFSALRPRLAEAGTWTEEEGRALTTTAAAIDRVLQALLRDIEPQLRKVMTNPLKDHA